MTESKQIKRTRMALSQSLIGLLMERDFDSISVTDICERAIMTRATFYKYFEDKYHLMRNIIQDYKERYLDKELESFEYTTPKQLYLKVAELCLNFVQEHQRAFFILVEHGINERLSMMVLNMINDYIEELLKTQQEVLSYNVPVSILSKFFTGGFAYLGMYFMKNKDKYTKEQILKYLDNMMDVGAFAQIK